MIFYFDSIEEKFYKEKKENYFTKINVKKDLKNFSQDYSMARLCGYSILDSIEWAKKR